MVSEMNLCDEKKQVILEEGLSDADNFEGEFDFYDGSSEESDSGIQSGVADLSTPVTNYTYTNMSYPCVIFKDGFQCPKHKLTVLSNMVNSGSKALKDISLYFRQQSELFELGKVSGYQMNAMLDLIGYDNLDGFYDSNIPLEGDKLYVLCSSVA